MTRVGVIGLGAMGSRMATRLLAAGYEVHGYNRTAARAQALEPAGLVAWDTPRTLAEHTDVVLSMVWDSAALREVALGPDGLVAGLTERHVYLDMSTVEPEASREVAAQVSRRGAVMLDCPVSGSLDAAESGRLVVFAGGPATALERVRPVLDQLSDRVLHLGEANGLGLALKLAVNLQVAIQEVAWGESLVLAERAGVSRAAATEAMLASVIASPMLRYRVPFVEDEPVEVWASAAQLRKDVAYAVERADGAALAGAVALHHLDAIVGAGQGGREAAHLIRVVADRIGAGPRVPDDKSGKNVTREAGR
jgi:3-hydroxyisobutyrate dehydrogenase-like beta-hydroxyacid dehydrogenase